MFLKNYRKNLRWLLTIFALLLTVFWCGANITTTNAQTTIDNQPTRKRIPRPVPMDFTGDGRTDWATISYKSDKPIRWKILGNPAIPAAGGEAFIRIFDYGFFGDFVVPGDYTGDRKTEVTVSRRQNSQSIYYIAQFPIGTGGITLDRAVYWNGGAGGDYDGDGKLDFITVRNNSVFTWYILSSRTNTLRTVNFGSTNLYLESLNAADFTGDGRDELVFTASDGGDNRTYYIGDAVTGALLLTRHSNIDASYILPFGDYTGDGKADFVLISSVSGVLFWQILDSATNTFTGVVFGLSSSSTRTLTGLCKAIMMVTDASISLCIEAAIEHFMC